MLHGRIKKSAVAIICTFTSLTAIGKPAVSIFPAKRIEDKDHSSLFSPLLTLHQPCRLHKDGEHMAASDVLPPGVWSVGEPLLMSFRPLRKLAWLVTSQSSAIFLQCTNADASCSLDSCGLNVIAFWYLLSCWAWEPRNCQRQTEAPRSHNSLSEHT